MQVEIEDDGTPVRCWDWDTGIGDTSVKNLGWLSNVCFGMETDIVSFGGSGKRCTIPLSSIRELRFSRRAKMLEIYHAAARPAVVWGRKSNVHVDIYDALKKAIACEQPPVMGRISSANSIASAATGLSISVVISVLLLVAIAFTKPENLLSSTIITSSIVMAFLGWFLFRLLRPHSAEVLLVRKVARREQ